MSRLFSHTPSAEDQPLAHTILWTHALTRAFQAGSLFGAGVSVPVYACFRIFSVRKEFLPMLLRSSGAGALLGAIVVSVSVVRRMWGKEEREWKDRSWRLMENRKQLELDDWTFGVMSLSLLPAMTKGGKYSVRGMVEGVAVGSALGMIGGVGLGSLLGLAGYMVWRYGIKRGKSEERKSV